MDRKLRPWEIALMMGVMLSLLLGGWLKGEQRDLADRVVRLHVIANSDSEADQQLKLAVRDRILEEAEKIYPPDATRAEAEQALYKALPGLSAAGQETVRAWGENFPVSARLEDCWFPTKEYGDFMLPAGTYRALRIVIGEGRGANWWCVAFPPLCMGAVSEPLENTVQAGHFTESQLALITEENTGYVIKFRSMELLGELERWLRSE